jgi:hypothetical protein
MYYNNIELSPIIADHFYLPLQYSEADSNWSFHNPDPSVDIKTFFEQNDFTLGLDNTGANLNEKFDSLADQWLQDTMFDSSVTAFISHPAYLRIIGMGEKAIPLLLNALTNKPGHWFSALASITGENPIPPGDAGNFDSMKQAWLDWGSDNNYM